MWGHAGAAADDGRVIRLGPAAPPSEEQDRDGGWAAAARAERGLQAGQVGILVVLALIVVAVAVVTGRGMVSELRDYRDIQRTQSALDNLKYTLQEQEAAFWRHRSHGGVGVPPAILANVITAAGQAGELARRPSVTEAVAADVVGRTLARLQALIDFVAGTPDPGPQGSRGDVRFIGGLTPLIADLKVSAGAWVEQNAATLEATNDRVTAATRRIITLTGITALLATALGLVAWLLVSRSRRRVHGALEAATERLRHLADTDPLTGLSNQRLVHDRLLDMLAEARATGGGLSAIMIDLDRFKAVNDTCGHPVGDLVLIETARRLRDSSRAGDVVARMGGEEFLMLLPDTGAATALAVAERVRAAVRDADYPGGVGRLTASLGVASLVDGIDADALLERADTALYWAKRNGRDAAFAYDPRVMGDLTAGNRANQLAREDGLAALRALARAIDARDAATQRHSIRVADMAALVAGVLGWTPEQTLRLREAALVHDVGKIGIPDAVLLKADALTAAERELMKDHARLGARIVSEVLDDDQVEWVAHHHERWDGSGYPLGLEDESIPEGARILAVADCWDAMTSERNYSPALTESEALAECARCSGSQFWPAAVEALLRVQAGGRPPSREAPELAEA